MAFPALGLGLVLALLDGYWGNGKGMLALVLLLAGSGAAQVAEYSRAALLLRRPRFPDALLAAGAAYADRTGRALAAADRTAREHGLAALLAGSAALAPQLRHPLFAASGLAALALEAFLGWGLFRLAVARAWIPPSRAAFHGRADEGRRPGRTGPTWIALTGTIARRATGRLPAPYGWLARRKALAVLRADPLAPGLFALLAIGSAAAFRASGDLFLCGFFALAGCMAALCLARRAGSASDRFAAAHAYGFPPERVRFRCDWGAALILAAAFAAYYAACAVSLLGPGKAARSQAVWQMAATVFAFACLIVKDGYAPGRGERAQAVLAAGYLGIGGTLFMFPAYGLALAALGAIAAAVGCLRHGA